MAEVSGLSSPWLRLRFAKLGAVRFLSHRDVARAWERALRRAAVPVAWSEGFTSRPLVSFGLALPTGAESVAEYLDVKLEGPVEMEALAERLTAVLPAGVAALGAGHRDHGALSLQQAVTSCCWELEVRGVSGEELAALVERVLASPSVPVARKRKGSEVHEDIRPQIRDLRMATAETPGHAGCLWTELATQPRGIRPVDLVAGLGGRAALGRARRTQQWIERDGARWEPLPLDGTGLRALRAAATHAEERAS